MLDARQQDTGPRRAVDWLLHSIQTAITNVPPALGCLGRSQAFGIISPVRDKCVLLNLREGHHDGCLYCVESVELNCISCCDCYWFDASFGKSVRASTWHGTGPISISRSADQPPCQPPPHSAQPTRRHRPSDPIACASA